MNTNPTRKGAGKRAVHVYRIAIIDIWGDENELDRDVSDPFWSRLQPPFNTTWLEFWGAVAPLARSLGWEGDIARGLYFCYLPWSEHQDGQKPFVVAWKQSNNGLTFIASKHRLPWLEIEENEHVEGALQ